MGVGRLRRFTPMEIGRLPYLSAVALPWQCCEGVGVCPLLPLPIPAQAPCPGARVSNHDDVSPYGLPPPAAGPAPGTVPKQGPALAGACGGAFLGGCEEQNRADRVGVGPLGCGSAAGAVDAIGGSTRHSLYRALGAGSTPTHRPAELAVSASMPSPHGNARCWLAWRKGKTTERSASAWALEKAPCAAMCTCCCRNCR